MKIAIFASLALLSACATHSTQPIARASEPAPATETACPVLPLSQHMWKVYREDIIEAKVDPEWLYPAYVGLSSLSWAGGAPFFPVLDLLMAPTRILDPCGKI